jgi:cell division protein ZipA
MAELRWILLAAGLALIAGIYLWGLRARRRSVASEPVRAAAHFEPLPPSEHLDAARAEPPGFEPERIEPDVGLDEGSPGVFERVPVVELRDGRATARSQAPARREPTLGQRLTASEPAAREPVVEYTHGAERAQAESAPDEDHESEDAVAARAQRIVAIRVTAPAPSRFEGSLLQEGLAAEGFEFGRYQIFHRLDPVGRPVISLASLREPGTFDPATMAGAAYAGVALFSVLPGPLPAQQAFEELLVVGRSLAGRLGGNLQDERGAALSVQRIAQLREEMLAFDRDRASRPAR